MSGRQSRWAASSPRRAFGARVRELHLSAGLTQEDLAERYGLIRTYMRRIEAGNANPTLTMIHALATSLAVPVPALFGEPFTPLNRGKTSPPSRGRGSR